jgi:16S rRNA (guanine966-N2)-methyltransferase
VLVEQGRDALAAIRENARALEAESRVRVVSNRVDRALATLEGEFDVVFLDPPYADVRAPEFAGILEAAARRLSPSAALVLEHASTDTPPAVAGLEQDRSRRYGDTTISLYRAARP